MEMSDSLAVSVSGSGCSTEATQCDCEQSGECAVDENADGRSL